MVPESDPKECRAWVFANVIRSPFMGDVYTLWVDDHFVEWFLHCFGTNTEVEPNEHCALFLTEGYNCKVSLREWDDFVLAGKLKYAGWNHLYANYTGDKS